MSGVCVVVSRHGRTSHKSKSKTKVRGIPKTTTTISQQRPTPNGISTLISLEHQPKSSHNSKSLKTIYCDYFLSFLR